MTSLRVLIAIDLMCCACGRVGYEAQARDALPTAANGCDSEIDSDTLALYKFDTTDSTLVDAVGDYPGDFVGTPRYAPGAAGCGTALLFVDDLSDYGHIDHDAAWNLDTGSVDVWFRADSIGRLGIVSRDASGTEQAGHLSIYHDDDGQAVARVQESNASNPDDGTVCTHAGAVSLGTWMHVGVNFGPPGLELWLDGERFDEPGVGRICQTGHRGGIAGNSNPWVVGATTIVSDEGSALPLSRPFTGAIDHLRISRARRDFSAP